MAEPEGRREVSCRDPEMRGPPGSGCPLGLESTLRVAPRMGVCSVLPPREVADTVLNPPQLLLRHPHRSQLRFAGVFRAATANRVR